MTVRVKEWTQRDFTYPGRDVLKSPAGAAGGPDSLAELSCLSPDPLTGTLRRAPAWTKITNAFPTDVDDVAGAFFDAANLRYCFIGEDDSGNMTLAYTTDLTNWSSTYTLISSQVLGGLKHRNVSYWGGYLWVIADDGNIYRGTSYTSSLSSFYTGGDALILAPMNDRLFAATDTGDIKRLLSDDSAMGDYHTPAASLNPIYLCPFRQYMTVVTKGDDDTIDIFRLPDYAAHGLHQLGSLPTPSHYSDDGCPVALFDDKIWIATQLQEQPGSVYRLDVYAFDGHEINQVAFLEDWSNFDTPEVSGLLVWADRLLFYDLASQSPARNDILTLVGDNLVEYLPNTDVEADQTYVPLIAALGDYLFVTDYNDPEGDQNCWYAHRSALADAYVITCRLDMGHPAKPKRLDTLAVLLDGAATNFDVIIKYRVDDDTAWTTATTQDGTRIVRITNLALQFYLLQIRVDLDDDTGNNQDIGIEAISAIYSVDE